jgi:hypothetical protein
VAVERKLADWLSTETVEWSPEESAETARKAGVGRVVQGSIQELPEGGFRWSLTLFDAPDGSVLAGPYEGWLHDGRYGLEWEAAFATLGVGGSSSGGSPWGREVPERTARWEAWGRVLAVEDGQDPVAAAQAYSQIAERYGAEGWGGELRHRALGWNLPLAQVGAQEEALLRRLARGEPRLDDAARESRDRLADGLLPGAPAIPRHVLSAPLIMGDRGRLVLEGRIP